jgi:hypothetical protein
LKEKLELQKIQFEEQIRKRAKEREQLKKEGKKEKVDPKYTKQILDRFT